MPSDDEAGPRPGELDFFISYSPADEAWAAWIAWTLEEAGYRTAIQAWDFVPGSNFIDFMHRGVSESAAVIAVLSRHYERSMYGRMEWTAALRADPEAPERRLLTVRVDDTPVEGLLATITYVDLVGVGDTTAARTLLLNRVEQALDGHARPGRRPGYPGDAALARHTGRPLVTQAPLPAQRWIGGPGWAGRRRPSRAPRYPLGPQDPATQDAVTVLHLAGPDFGRGREPDSLSREIHGELIVQRDNGAPAPDLLVVTGDLTASGSPRECDQALSFLSRVRAQLDLPPQRVIVVPGAQDVNQAACRAYFHTCEADEVAPQPPYWPKWRHYTRLFRSFYQGLDTVFDSDQPWTLFPVPELGTVVAGFNSSIAYSHRLEDQYGHIGRDQAVWFAEALRSYEEEGWLRIGALRHPLTSGARPGDALGGPGALDDTDTLTELAAPRLHLLLHGPTGGPRTTGGIPGHTRIPGIGADPEGGLPVLSAAAPARFQLLRIAPDGITRWYDRGRSGPDSFPGTWPRAGRLFPMADRPAESDPGPVPADRDQAVDAPDSLIERVKEVCLARRAGVRLRDVPRRGPGDMAQLMATWREEGVVRQLRIAVHSGTPTDDHLDRFVAQLHAAGPGAEAELVHDGPAPGAALRERAVRHGVRVRSFLEFQGLLDLRGYVTGQTGRLFASEQYAPARYLPQRYHDADRPDGAEHDDLVEDLLELLEADHGRFVLLLGDFGHGKTFALRELARRVPEQLPHLTPLLIPLNTLDRAHSLEGLVAAHLAGHAVDTIDLRALRYMLAQGRVVLLFDGFDELVNRVSYDRAADHLQVLLDAAVDNAKIIVSSRTQHFRSHQQILTALGERVGLLPQRRILSVEGFTPAQIRAYLLKTYGDEEAATRRYRLLENIPDLLGLCRNPRLLSFVTQLDTDRLRAVAGAGRALSPARLYEDIFTSWLQYEQERGRGGPGSLPGLTAAELWAAVTALAQRLWESGRTALRLDELTEAVAATLSRVTEAPHTGPELGHAVGAGSLLVRTEEGLFHFIHSSVEEWLIAREAARRLDRGQYGLLHARPLSRLAVEFFCDLADHERCVRWVRRTLDASRATEDATGTADAIGTTGTADTTETAGATGATGSADRGNSAGTPGGVTPGARVTVGDAARANALRIAERLRVPAHTDLRGARLAGEDLSHRDFAGVDLTGADLTDARLVGATLTEADLTGARLVGARLDRADLRGADLTGADLRRARLTRTDLRGARLTGSSWYRAALIDPVLDDATRAAPELRNAAIAPGMPVDAGFRPSTVGVPYGFGMRTGRLPEPIAYSPDGELLLVGSDDGGVLVCAADDGRALRTLQGHAGRVYAVKQAPGVIASGGSDGTVRLWDPVSGRSLHRLDVHPDGVWPVVLNDDGTLLATGDSEGLVTVWDVATGEPVHRLPGHLAPVYTAVFGPDGHTLVTGDAAADVRLWSLRTGGCTGVLNGHRGAVYRVCHSPDGSLIATGDRGDGRGGTVRIWGAGDGRLRHEFPGHGGRVYTLAFHPEGRLLVSGDTDGTVRLWDPVVGTPLGTLERCPGGVYQVVFSRDGKLLAGCDSAGTVRLWTVTGTPRQGHVVTLHERQPSPHRGSVWACAFHPRDHQLLTVGNDGGARIWEAGTGQGKRILRGHGRRVTGVTFSADGSRLATCGSDGAVRLWDTRTGCRTHELAGRGDRLVSAAFSPAGSVLGTASSDGAICLWNQDGDFLRELDAETEHIWAEAFNKAGDLLATANDDDTVCLWYRSTGARVATLSEHRGRVRSIAFHGDGEVLATGCDDSRVRLWQAREGRLSAELRGHEDRVYGVAFGPGDQWLASASWDGTVIVWRDGEARLRLSAGGGKLWTVAAHPTRPVLAAAGDSRTITLWNADTGARLAELTGHTGRVLSIAFSPDGTALAGGGEDGTVRLWDLPADGGAPSPRATLIGVPEGWAALTPSGGYKYEGDVAGEFWHVVGMTRFAPGELDAFLPGVRRLALGEEL
ncbi:TIR domain-containing protein [Streptomyces sp. SP18CS02]|uniref:WD40 domain-containing protein n=1 Tax=Streptomyces sp. SP18CS02 TaxID=3002531 RepID=UPI002E783067|nr:TIR domain-containing protein [Streptomyces sp. SP18CS02]MEE1755002.1 TIR domain-containing protein [Streptomyces sp. SP18CS02]